MARRRSSASATSAEIDLTPMLDVVFIMLIFFIVTASFVKEAGVDVIRPPAQTADPKDKGNILIAITESGQIWIDRRAVDASSLQAHIERLHGENPQGSIVVQADKNSQNSLLVTVMDAARDAGVTQIAIAAEGV
jgi:biopolymer transport protein ExbD